MEVVKKIKTRQKIKDFEPITLENRQEELGPLVNDRDFFLGLQKIKEKFKASVQAYADKYKIEIEVKTSFKINVANPLEGE